MEVVVDLVLDTEELVDPGVVVLELVALLVDEVKEGLTDEETLEVVELVYLVDELVL